MTTYKLTDNDKAALPWWWAAYREYRSSTPPDGAQSYFEDGFESGVKYVMEEKDVVKALREQITSLNCSLDEDTAALLNQSERIADLQRVADGHLKTIEVLRTDMTQCDGLIAWLRTENDRLTRVVRILVDLLADKK